MNSRTRLLIATIVFLLVSAVYIYGLGAAFVPLISAFAVAYLVLPLIQKLEQKGINRQVAIFSLGGIGLLIIVLVLVAVVPKLVRESAELVEQWPVLFTSALERLQNFAEKLGLSTYLDKDYLLAHVQEWAETSAGSALKQFSAGLAGLVTGLAASLIAILNIFLFPLFFYYVLSNFEERVAAARNRIPESIRPIVLRYARLADRVMSGYIRGQLMVAGIVGICNAIGLSLLGLKFGFIVGLLSGALNIIPYVGFVIGFGAALVLTMANFSWLMLGGVCLVFFSVQALEGTAITPKLVGDSVGLGPLATMLALILGGNLLGFVGMLIAIPAYAISSRMIKDLLGWLLQTKIEARPSM